MTAPVLQLGPIADHLRAAGIYRSVGRSADLKRVSESGALGGPLCFLLPGSEKSQPSGVVGGIQAARVEGRFIVMTLAEDIQRGSGAGALTQLEDVRAQLLPRMASFRPSWADGPALHDRGQLVTGPLPGGLLGWQDEFTLRWRRSITPTGG